MKRFDTRRRKRLVSEVHLKYDNKSEGTFAISWLLDSDPGSIYFLLLTFWRDQRWCSDGRLSTIFLGAIGSGHTFTRPTVYISLNYRDADEWKRTEAVRVVHLQAGRFIGRDTRGECRRARARRGMFMTTRRAQQQSRECTPREKLNSAISAESCRT